MTDAIVVTTKLQLPPRRTDAVVRPRLTVRLDLALRHKLTLVIAPAGFGKTTLLSEWLQRSQLPVAWLSLDEYDDSLPRFLRYLIYAVRQLVPNFGAGSLALLDSTHAPQQDSLLTQLANDLTAISETGLLVLDDYHVLQASSIHHAVDFLLAHLPPHLHVIIASRAEPPLNLALLRGRAQLLELDSAHLRFTAVEVERFLRDVMQLDLDPADRVTLEMRTEGWITGLQLAALSLQSHDDSTAFLAAFRGTHRYIADFLFEEVLRHQPDSVQRFLLHTSIVDALCGDLCDTLLGGDDGQQMLERVEKAGLFIIPMDDERRWYRYHHLFAEMLRQHLTRAEPDQIAYLHRQASRWYAAQGWLDAAIQHGLQAGEFERAADLIDAAFEQKDWVQHDMHRLLDWFDALPPATTRTRADLLLAHAWLLFEIFADQWDRIERDLQSVEHLLSDQPDLYPQSERQLLMAQVDLLRANHAQQHGDFANVIRLCNQALDRLPADETYIRSGVTAHLGAAYEQLGDMQQASPFFTTSLQMCQVAGNIDGLLFATAHLIVVKQCAGQLHEVDSIVNQFLAYSDQRTGPDVGAVYIAIGGVYLERNHLQAAHEAFQKGIDLCKPFEAWRQSVAAGVFGLARVLAAEGHVEQALEKLREIDPLMTDTIAKVEALRARLYLADDRYAVAAQWLLKQRPLNVAQFSYAHEFDLLTRVRVLLALAMSEAQNASPVTLNPLDDAGSLLQLIHAAALTSGRQATLIEVQLLQALVYAAKNDHKAAWRHLQDALMIAEPAGYMRLFVDEGLPLYRLLIDLQTRPLASAVSPDYLNTVIAAFPREIRSAAHSVAPVGSALTAREQAALRLLASDHSIEEIAAELSVAISTVRTYAKRIYGKLGVHSRAEAVYRAKELQLL